MATKKILANLDLIQNELQNAVIQVLASDPATGKLGQIYYNSTHKALMQYDGARWNRVGVVYQQDSTTGAVITGLDANGNVTTTNVTGLTLTGYTPVEGGYVTAGMTMQEAMQAMDTAIKNAVAGGGEVNQNAWSKISIPAQSTAATAVTGQAEDIVLSSDAKVDTFTIKTGNKWVDINGSGKTVNIGHSLSGATAGVYGASNAVAKVTVDEAGHVTEVNNVEITPVAIGAATTAAVEAAQNTATAAQASADAKVASVTAAENGGIDIGGTKTAPTVGIKLDPTAGNAATLGAAGLMVTIPEVTVPVYDIVKDADSGDYAAIYHLTKDGTNTGAAINIPKDLFVKEGKVVDNPTGQPAGKYIELTLQNQTNPIYINVADLVDAYTPGNGITISATNEVSAKVVAANGLSVGASGIAMALASDVANGAMSSDQFTKLGGIADNATANAITLNGVATPNPTFYAPTTGGTAGQQLVSGGDGAPVWQDMPTNLKKYSDNNTELTAVGGVFTWTISAATHGISQPLVVQLFEVASGAQVIADVTVASAGITIQINDSANVNTLTANTYKVVIIG
nr:MAG TPA: hypothetical protein [Caudoviricetes sp.]